jgi:hypothetical protein
MRAIGVISLHLAVVLFGCSDSSPSPTPNTGPDGAPCDDALCRDAAQADSADARRQPDATDATAIADASDAGRSADGPSPESGAPANVLVSDPAGERVSQLQMGSGFLYWVGGTHRIARVAIDGTGATTLHTQPGTSSSTIAIGGIAIDNTNLYFTHAGDGNNADRGVYKIPLDGAAAPLRLAQASNPFAIAVDGDDICFTNGADVGRVSKSGGAVTTLVRDAVSYRTRLVVHRGHLFFAAGLESMAEELYRLPVTASLPPLVDAGAGDAQDDAGPRDAAEAGAMLEKISVVPGRYTMLLSPRVDGDFVYWGASDSVYRWSEGTAAVAVAVVQDPLNPMNTSPPSEVLYPFDGTIYWVSTWATSGTIYKQSVPNGTRTTIANFAAASIVADNAYLYAATGSYIVRYPR